MGISHSFTQPFSSVWSPLLVYIGVFMVRKRYARLRRYRKIINVLVKYEFGYVVEQLGLLKYWTFGSRMLHKKSGIENKTVEERARMVLEELGPTYVKLGQILSTRYDLLPERFITEFAKLQDVVPPFPFSEAIAIIESELGKTIDELFASIESVPVAAASIGQVHRAVLKSGEDVVIKVQRPDITDTINTDLKMLNDIAVFAQKHIKEGVIYNFVDIVEEFSHVIHNELDYIKEGQNADKFHNNFIHVDSVYIPKVYWEYTTKRVLTLEYATGVKINDLKKLDKVGLDRKKVARNFATAYVKMLFDDGFFHGDPHPGNVFVMPNEVILFLDFGMAGSISKTMMSTMTNVMIATVKKDVEMLIDSLVEMGVVNTDEIDMMKFRTDTGELMDRYYSTSLRNVSPDILLKELIDLLMEHHGKVPSNIMLLSKTLMMEEEINTRLDPDYNLAEIAEPFVHDLFKKRSRPDHLLKDAAKIVLDYAGLLQKMPRKIDHVMARLEKGALKLEFEHKGLDMVVKELDTMSNRISFALIISAIIVGSSLILQTDMTPRIYDAPLLGIVGFIIAGIMGFGLVMSIIRSGKY